ncbi:dehydrogenase/reductase SDR family member on chromosome X [Orussus abietinus]|uniref:dehydrogenase/reductase SDR family member on chromosome X n=1 Tax=Orussus abietinus TaxID=222816 RepID=UPI0006250222|nr:dehydrogenase/reductase SDR family member on chromosome X [Orussus abietinus]
MQKPEAHQRKKYRNMFLTLGSVLTVLAGFLYYYKPPLKFSIIRKAILNELEYNVLAVKEIVADFLNAKYNKIELCERPDKVVIVTGGSRGIGATIVKLLLKCDMEVIIACRNPAAGDMTIRQIREAGITKGRACVYELDNASFKSIRRFSEKIKENYTKIDILVNNAGIMFTPYSEMEDGFEQQWGVNYLSHFLLTSLLLPLLKAAGTKDEHARIVNISSCAHILGSINFEDVNCKNEFIAQAAYSQSKLAQVMFTKTLQELLKQENMYIDAYAVHPGIVNTDIFQHSYVNKLQWLKRLLFKSPEQGATSVVFAIVDISIQDKGGLYFSNCREVAVNRKVFDPELRERLFQLSLKQTQLKDFIQKS